MNEPVIVFDRDNKVVVYRTLELAEGFLEAIDIEDGEYPAAYTSDGEMVRISVDGSGMPKLERMAVVHVSELVSRLLVSMPARFVEPELKGWRIG